MVKEGLLRVRDFDGDEKYFQRESEVLGIDGDARACKRFDAAFLDQLGEHGVTSANQLKDAAGLAYATAQAAFKTPHQMTHRVFLVVTGNVGLSVDVIVNSASYDGVRAGFDAEHESVRNMLGTLAHEFLMLDADKQMQAVRLVHALRGRKFNEGTQTHVTACIRLAEQCEPLVLVKPEQAFEIVDDADWSAPRVKWRDDETGNIITDLAAFVETL